MEGTYLAVLVAAFVGLAAVTLYAVYILFPRD
jgi:hypothetical protein